MATKDRTEEEVEQEVEKASNQINDDAYYAIAAWQRFEQTISNSLLRAMTSAFALVVAADGDLAASEIERFGALLQQQSLPLARIPTHRIQSAFNDVISALMSDPHRSRERALATISIVMNNDIDRELVLATTQIAVQADHKERAGERAAVNAIRAALGLTAVG